MFYFSWSRRIGSNMVAMPIVLRQGLSTRARAGAALRLRRAVCGGDGFLVEEGRWKSEGIHSQ
jgi:hypothetical protein